MTIWLDRSFDFYKVTWSVSRMEITFFYCSCATKENERERLNYQKTISFVFADMDTSKRQFTINKTLLDCVLYAILLLIVENNGGGVLDIIILYPHCPPPTPWCLAEIDPIISIFFIDPL